MDRRTILAVVLCLAIYYAWLVIRGPQHRPEEAPPEGEVAAGPAAETPPAPVAPPPAPEEVVPAQELPFELCGLKGTVSSDGGRVTAVAYPEEEGPYHVTPLYKWIAGLATGSSQFPWSPYGADPGPAYVLSDRAAGLVLGSGTGDPGARRPMRVAVEDGRVVASGVSADGIAIERVLTEERSDAVCKLVVDTTWRNATTAPYAGTGWISIHDHTPVAASSYESQRQPTAVVDGSMVYGGRLGKGCVRRSTMVDDAHPRIEVPGEVSWFGVSDRYFGFYLVPPEELHPTATLALTRIGQGDDALDGGVLSLPLELAPGAARTERFTAYGGPNHEPKLAAVHPDLPLAVDLGFFTVFARPLLWLMRQLHTFTANWGLSIILVTLMVKAVFFPMTQRSFASMQKMQKIQPELQRIKEEFAEDPQEMNRRTIEVMQRNQVNPVTGCLPMFLQMPVFFALYNVLLTSVELYHTEFLYLKDLASPDPYGVLPLLIMFVMWLQQQFTTPAAGMDPVQQQVMRYMPLLFGLFFFAMPSGLGVYMFVNTTLSILQQWWIKRTVGTPPPAPSAAGA